MRKRVIVVLAIAGGVLIGLGGLIAGRQWLERRPESGVLGIEERGPKKAPGVEKLRQTARLGKDTKATLIVDVESLASDWNAEQTVIQTTARLRTVEKLDGEAPAELSVTQPGGEVGDLGLAVSHVTAWEQGERALVLLAERGGRYHVVGGDKGKLKVKDRRVPELNLSVDQVARVIRTGQVTADLEAAAAEAPAGDGVAQFSSDFVLLPYRWTAAANAVPYLINPANVPNGVTPDTFAQAISAAFATWATNTNNAIGARYAGTTALAGNQNDGQNLVYWAPIDTPGVLGRAMCWYNPATRSNLDCDVQFDPNDWAWDTRAPPSPNGIDVESVALHEFGHFFGLNHSADPRAIMFASLMAGELKRSPNADDLAGIVAIYGAGGETRPAPPPAPVQVILPILRRSS